MRVKRYVVESMPDALQQIRSDLGKDAVILNTKEIRSGGFLGLFSKKKIEVIAATDSASAPPNTGRPRQADILTNLIQNAQTGGASPVNQPVAVMDQPAPPPAAIPASTESEQMGMNHSHHPAGIQQVVTAQYGAAAYGSPSVKPDHAKTTETKPIVEEDAVLAELRSMKQIMQKLSANGSFAPAEPNPVLERLENRLLEQEIRPDIVESLISEIEQHSEESGEEITSEFAEQTVKDRLRILLGANTNKPLQPDTRIAHFVGPTGVGKTTTIAKLAAEQVLKYRRKVGFITSDTYRIAAVDQLKTYATILGVPLEVVFSPQDLRKAFEVLKDRDIIFMDTAGRNFRNEMYVSELNALLHSGGKSETYMVLSLTMKYKDMRAIADNFSKFKLDKVLFTKRDETDSFGPIINLLNEFPLQLSYITTGQNVPDDFAIADENEIIDLILEEQSDE